MTSKTPSRRAFLLSTLVAAPALGRARASQRQKVDEQERERDRLVQLAETYGSELGSLRKVGR